MKSTFIACRLFLNTFLVIVFCFFITETSQAQSAVSPFPKNTKRVLLLGNSITYAGTYITDIETYFAIHFPKEKIEFINEGLPSETVSCLSEPNHADGKFPRPDLHERLARVLAITKPDVVFACYGMNDGIYLPFDSARFNAYRNGILWLHSELEKAGAKEIILLTPPVHDDAKLGTKGYNLVLDAYSNWLLSLRESMHWKVGDIHFLMTNYINNKRLTEPTFKLADDGVHPGEEGHWLMAKAVLLYLKQPVENAANLFAAIDNNKHAKELYELVNKRQQVMKDAWLTTAGHKRPGMNKGIPLEEAKKQYDSLQLEIDKLLK